MTQGRGGGTESGRAYETVARAESERGEVVLRRRPAEPGSTGQGEFVHELRVNGVTVLDTSNTTSERRLATATLARLDRPARVLVGGLGLGFTVHVLLDDRRIERIDVVELEPAVVDWMNRGLVPDTADVMRSTRVHVRIGDVRQVVADAAPGSFDAVLLDVDNGPGFLVYPHNARVYSDDFLSACAHTLRPAGALAVWSSAPAPALHDALERTVGPCQQVETATGLGSREASYHVYVSLKGVSARTATEGIRAAVSGPVVSGDDRQGGRA
jgi:Spermine/spermidine synthase domain